MALSPGFRSMLRPLLLAAVVLPLAGCTLNSTFAPSNAPAINLTGITHGGPNPVAGATVQLYATTSGGYGAAPTLLATASTNASGSFSFTSAAPCTAGQQAYITAYGGNPGSGNNPNYLLMAALGPCATINSATSIWIDELTTVAAAYTLRPFMTIGGTPGAPVVQVGAPANNNAATGTCATTANVTTGCTAAGLSHAFANALNIANSVSIGGVAPNGTAYFVTPANPSGVVPAALLNSLANSIEACVNSTGGAANDSTPCGNLFAYTTPPVAAATAPANTLQAMMNVAQYPALTPANVTGLFNMATPISFYNPALTAAPTDYSVAIGYSGVTVPGTVGTIVVSPIGSGYTSAPVVTFTGGGTTSTAATASASLGLATLAFTANPTTTCTAPVVKFTGGTPVNAATATATASGGVITGVTITNPGSGYASVPAATFTGTGCTGGTLTPSLGVVAVALTNAGAGYSSSPTVTLAGGGGSGAAATANYAVTTFGAPYVFALDANDDLYVGSQNASAITGTTGYITAIGSNGSSIFTSTPNTTYTSPRGAAVDSLGHVWFSANNTIAMTEYNTSNGAFVSSYPTAAAPFGVAIDRANNIWYGVPASATQDLYELQQSAAYTNAAFTVKPVFTNATRGVAIDANQNIWASGYGATTETLGVFPNSGTVAAPVYGATAAVLNTTLTGNTGAAIAIDGGGNAWTASSTGITEVLPTTAGTPATITSIAPSANSPIADNTTAPLYDEIDGGGNVWLATGSAVVEYLPGLSLVATYSPCYVPNGAQTCAAGSVSTAQRTAIDSSGSVWLTSLGNGRIYQLLGTGAPTWPQLSLGQPGVTPQ